MRSLGGWAHMQAEGGSTGAQGSRHRQLGKRGLERRPACASHSEKEGLRAAAGRPCSGQRDPRPAPIAFWRWEGAGLARHSSGGGIREAIPKGLRMKGSGIFQSTGGGSCTAGTGHSTAWRLRGGAVPASPLRPSGLAPPPRAGSTPEPQASARLTFLGCLFSECSFSFATVEVQLKVDRQTWHCRCGSGEGGVGSFATTAPGRTLNPLHPECQCTAAWHGDANLALSHAQGSWCPGRPHPSRCRSPSTEPPTRPPPCPCPRSRSAPQCSRRQS